MGNPFDNKISSIEKLIHLAVQNKYTYFTNYINEQEVKRTQFRIPIDHLGIEIKDKIILDIGPGTGDSLVEAKTMGAKKLMAIDSNPYFTKLQMLRGVHTYYKNYTRKDIMTGRYFPIELSGVDFIWSKGAMNGPQINKDHNTIKGKCRNFLKMFDFADWIDEAISLLNPNGKFLFMPAPTIQSEYIEDPNYPISTNYWVPDIKRFDSGYFAKVLLAKGFIPIKGIEKYNHPKAFPTAYLYNS
tara:strand:+ start:380 stop:1108 length:729 start_codon:yes stop_codon:yes gene_type:complete